MERDDENSADLDYAIGRYYDLRLGRFLTPDSARYSGLSDPQSLNLYSYVGNHPTFLIDPDGRCWQWAQKLCDAAKNIGQRFDNLFHGEGFRTDQGVENYAHQHNAERRQQEVNGSTAGRLGQRSGEFHRNWDRWWAAHDCENSMGGCGLAPSLASLGVYTRPTRTLFRAVSRAEFEDIQKTGKFRASPGGAESKYFYPSLEQAEKMGERMYGEDYGVVVGDFPESAVEGPFPVATEGDVFTVPNENLELARPAVEVPLDTPEIPE
jgi:RHS repeat-associated protein